MKKTAQKINPKTGSVINVRKTHRNDPCPCGQEEITTYRAADGSIIKQEKTQLKFKHCCMNETGEQAGTQKSSGQLLKEKRQHVGWPMRDYLSTPLNKRGDFKEGAHEPMGAVPRTYNGKNNRKPGRGRPVIYRPTDILLGTSVMLAVGSTKGTIRHNTVKWDTHTDPKSGIQVANRLQFIPFEYENGKGNIVDQIGRHHQKALSILKDYANEHGWRVSLLEKWQIKTQRTIVC